MYNSEVVLQFLISVDSAVYSFNTVRGHLYLEVDGKIVT